MRRGGEGERGRGGEEERGGSQVDHLPDTHYQCHIESKRPHNTRKYFPEKAELSQVNPTTLYTTYS